MLIGESTPNAHREPQSIFVRDAHPLPYLYIRRASPRSKESHAQSLCRQYEEPPKRGVAPAQQPMGKGSEAIFSRIRLKIGSTHRSQSMSGSITPSSMFPDAVVLLTMRVRITLLRKERQQNAQCEYTLTTASGIPC